MKKYKLDPTPDWATELTKRVLDKYKPPYKTPPKVKWKITKGKYFSGKCYDIGDRNIHIRVGMDTPRWEQKLVLLHELAHWLRPVEEGHSPQFWELAFRLYKENGLPLRKALHNETDYLKGAENGYRKVMGYKPKKRKMKILSRFSQIPNNIVGIYQGINLYWIVKRTYFRYSAKEEKMKKLWSGIRISKGLFNRMKKTYRIIDFKQ